MPGVVGALLVNLLDELSGPPQILAAYRQREVSMRTRKARLWDAQAIYLGAPDDFTLTPHPGDLVQLHV